MKIVQINATYGVGSTGTIAKEIHQHLLEKGNDSYVFWGAHANCSGAEEEKIFRIGNTLDHKMHAVIRRIFKNQGWNSRFATVSLCRKLKKINPDLVHLHNLHSNYINLPYLLRFLGKNHIPTALTLHDCWLFTGSCTHFIRQACSQWQEDGCTDCPLFKGKIGKEKVRQFYLEKQELFSKIENLGVIGVSDWIRDCGKASLLSCAKMHQRIYNWVDLNVFSPRENTQEVRAKYKIEDGQALILGVSQGWNQRKGLYEFVQIAEKLKGKARVLLVGTHYTSTEYENIDFLGYTKNQEELADLYAAADVFVNPSRMETFGKVTAEALASGTPVAAYSNTGTKELIFEDTGILVEDGNAQMLLSAVETILENKKEAYTDACVEWAKAMFYKTKLLDEHIAFYEALIENTGKE